MVAFLVSRSAKTDIADSVSWCISLMIFTHFDCFLLMICWRTGNSMKHSTAPPVPIFWSHHISTSSAIYCWRDTRQHGVYLVIVMAWHNCTTHHFCKARVSVGMQSTQSLCSILRVLKSFFLICFSSKSFYLISWILYEFWSVLTYDILRDRRINDVIINDIFFFFGSYQIFYVCQFADARHLGIYLFIREHLKHRGTKTKIITTVSQIKDCHHKNPWRT